MRVAANILQFQIAWFACVLGAAQGRPALGAGAALGLTVLHIALSGRVRRELAIVLFAAALGFVLDSALVQLELVSFPVGTVVTGTSPYWMVALWMSFATTLNVSLSWLGRRRALAALLGGVGGPAAYSAGAALGAVQVAASVAAYIKITMMWAVAMPVLLVVSHWLERARDQRRNPCGCSPA